ncbi:MAG: LysM peptidoglycan-binding domain-containing protein [Chloroflexota bacterium]
MSDQEPFQPEAEYQELTELGITPKQLWQIIGLNALISTAISLLIILFLGPWIYGGLDRPVVENGEAVSQLALPPSQNNVDLAQNQGEPTPTPVPEPVLYRVLPGDSLSLIADRHNVSLRDIMAANGLDDPDTIQAGQQLVIPIGGIPLAAPTFTPISIPTETPIPFDPPTPEDDNASGPVNNITIKPTSSATPIPTASPAPAGQVAVQISNVLGYGQVEEEVITIINQGPGINLSGWQLKGSRLGSYAFPNLFLWNGGSVRIHTRVGANTPSDLYWRQDQAYWFSGDTVTLVNANGDTISQYIIP